MSELREAAQAVVEQRDNRGANVMSIDEAKLHAAVCQAVQLLNVAPEVARCAEARAARDLLRQALLDYADAYMDQPATERERAAVASKHRRAR